MGSTKKKVYIFIYLPVLVTKRNHQSVQDTPINAVDDAGYELPSNHHIRNKNWKMPAEPLIFKERNLKNLKVKFSKKLFFNSALFKQSSSVARLMRFSSLLNTLNVETNTIRRVGLLFAITLCVVNKKLAKLHFSVTTMNKPNISDATYMFKCA